MGRGRSRKPLSPGLNFSVSTPRCQHAKFLKPNAASSVRIDAVLSGYLGDRATGPVLLDIVERVRGANPAALFCVDPVIGDVETGSYVTEGIAEFFRDRALAIADIVTPNHFELEYLTGRGVANLAEAANAAESLRARGPRIALVTSLDAAPDHVTMLAAGPEGAWAVETPRLPVVLNGCGDVTAALFLAHLLRGQSLPDALVLKASTSFSFSNRYLPRGNPSTVKLPSPILINFSTGCISFINARRNSSFFESRIVTSYQKFAARPRVASGCRTVFIFNPTSFPIRSKSAKVSIPFTLT